MLYQFLRIVVKQPWGDGGVKLTSVGELIAKKFSVGAYDPAPVFSDGSDQPWEDRQIELTLKKV